MPPESNTMGAPITNTELQDLGREANRAAWRLIHQTGLPAHEQEDLSQDFLVDLIARLQSFDPDRGTLGAFAATIVGHRAGRLANRIWRHRTVFPPVSLDDPLLDAEGSTLGDTIAEADGYSAVLGQPTDQFAEVERRIDLDRALGTLPRSAIALCAALTQRTPTEINRDGVGARATVYRELREIRLRLMSAGVSA
jgi:DNA-directed RNA polymerase specialized sigma24 family protein